MAQQLERAGPGGDSFSWNGGVPVELCVRIVTGETKKRRGRRVRQICSLAFKKKNLSVFKDGGRPTPGHRPADCAI